MKSKAKKYPKIEYKYKLRTYETDVATVVCRSSRGHWTKMELADGPIWITLIGEYRRAAKRPFMMLYYPGGIRAALAVYVEPRFELWLIEPEREAMLHQERACGGSRECARALCIKWLETNGYRKAYPRKR